MGLRRRLRRMLLKTAGVRMGARCWINRIDIPRNPWDIALGDNVALDDGIVLLTTGDRRSTPRIAIGDRCYVNRFTMLDACERVEIGAECMIGPFCYITDHDHGMCRDQPVRMQPLCGLPVTIGRDVWIGAGVTILKGVRIGDGAVIGAGSVITRDVAPFTKVAGVPGQQIGMRG